MAKFPLFGKKFEFTAFLQSDLFLHYLFRKKQTKFRFSDAMTSSYFLVIGHRAPAGVSFRLSFRH